MQKTNKKFNALIIMYWLLYTCAYLGRYSFNSNITLIENAFSIKHADSGLVTTLFFFAYGAGQIINGIFCKKYNKKIVLSLALIVSSLINFAIFLGVPFALYKYLWFINGCVQSILWSSIICALSMSLDQAYLKKAIIVMSTSTSVGTLLAYGVSALFSLTNNFKWSFLFAFIVLSVVAIVWFLLYDKITVKEDASQQVDNKTCDNKNANINKLPTKKLSNSILILIIILSFFAICANLIKDGLNTWVPTILKENFNLTDSLSIILTLTLPILGIFGALLANVLYNKIKDFITLSGVFFTISAICLFVVTILLNGNLWFVILLLFGLTVMFTHSINNIITSMMPMYMRDKINSGKTAGLLNGFCYVGSTISSYGLGSIADVGGWNSVFILLLAICLLSVLFTIIHLIKNTFKKVK